MLQRNESGYTLHVQPDDGTPPFELAPGEEVDYPHPIAGCAVEPPPAKNTSGSPARSAPDTTADEAPAEAPAKTTKKASDR